MNTRATIMVAGSHRSGLGYDAETTDATAGDHRVGPPHLVRRQLLLQGIVVVVAAMFKEGLSFATLPFAALAAFLIWVLKHLVISFMRVWRGRPA